ncbi:3-oxoadipate enol-lactonase [Paenibacillus macquariensis subsp. macquariensis]|uniref:3-oxoadipate enol-lactonase n=2 Tax=Paenibacillus macquariensis TaxID=948756 RepID=A0ABY1JUW9_9BACL|nr:3-oxoadipate enol-lactonase [Paenibacillus macquariensis subsp. macquariensis]SIQ81872.1 3-oxoadipate enol-lactonase [Paenibacillus macquariensis]
MTLPLNECGKNDGVHFFTTGDGHRIAYRFDGPANGPVLVLANSIATTFHMWDGQIEELSNHFRVLRYDFRGHGASDAPIGTYSIDRMGRDVVELLDALHISKVHFLGLSLGGFVGQWLGIHVPERIDRLILVTTSSNLGPPETFDRQIAGVWKAENLSEIADTFLGNWFPPHMLETEGDVISSFRAMILSTNKQGRAGAYAAIRDSDMHRTIALINSPTLVIAGQYDKVTLPSHNELIAATVPNAKYVLLPTVHMPNIERQADFLKAVFEFLLLK